ncbi:hypothetical protein KIW84_021624 [Lathyrus oleraceus]|uniref:Uncharacterized protein n=1 Tax=Pisum sativum TaxID=3888 RepID=A0A9D5B8U4_PEA|nr:hypothetical protein KIW84_021624 [Pisum sativum]
MTYEELYPSLVLKNLLQPRNPPQILEPLPWWYKPELHYAFHQGAPGHDIENCYPLKYEVQKLVKNGMVSFEDRAPNVKANPLPTHRSSSVNMMDGCPGEFKVFDVRFIRRSLEMMHKDICLVSDCEHDHDGCAICSVNPQGLPVFKNPERVVIQYDSSNSNSVNKRSVSSLVIWLAGPIPYASDKAVPYQYNATMLKDGQEVPLPTTNSVISIADVTKVTHSGRVFGPVFPKNVEDLSVNKKVDMPIVESVSAPMCQSSESSGLKSSDNDEVLRLIKKSEFNIVEQLLQTPSKISVLSLLMNSKAHREALQKVIEQAYVEHDVTVDQFDHTVANITSCNNLNFCDEELPEEGRNHNLAFHISMNYKDDAMSNVFIDTGSSFNVLPKSTLSKLSYQGAPMRYSGVVVKAFDGSRKTVIGDVDLPVKIGLSDFHITFQVMDIHPTYRCLLGRPLIHEAGAITSILHQKLKFVKNGKLVIAGGEKALLVSHLSSFSYVEVEDEVGTLFQALSIAVEKRVGALMSLYKDALKIVEDGSSSIRAEDMQLSFRSGGFIHSNEEHLAAVLEDDEEEDCTNFVTHGKACNNWTLLIFLLVSNPIEYNDPSSSPKFEFPVFEAEEESDEEDSEIVEHRLPLKPECSSVKQKLRRTHPDMAVKIREEV